MYGYIIAYRNNNRGVIDKSYSNLRGDGLAVLICQICKQPETELFCNLSLYTSQCPGRWRNWSDHIKASFSVWVWVILGLFQEMRRKLQSSFLCTKYEALIILSQTWSPFINLLVYMKKWEFFSRENSPQTPFSFSLRCFTELFLSNNIKYCKNDIEWQTSIPGMRGNEKEDLKFFFLNIALCKIMFCFCHY